MDVELESVKKKRKTLQDICEKLTEDADNLALDAEKSRASYEVKCLEAKTQREAVRA